MWNKVACNSNYEDFLKAKESKRYHRSLNEIKPIVNTSRPKIVSHLKKRSKKNQLLDERHKEIEHKNQVLMEKMVFIDNRHKGLNFVKHSFRSLNKETRSKNNTRINQENSKLLERLQSAQPVLSQEKWVLDERHWMNLRGNIKKVKAKGSRPCSSRESESFELIQKILKRRNTRPTTALSTDFAL